MVSLRHPFLKKRVLNIGARQLGRVADKHVRHCSNESEKNFAALDKLFSEKNSDGKYQALQFMVKAMHQKKLKKF